MSCDSSIDFETAQLEFVQIGYLAALAVAALQQHASHCFCRFRDRGEFDLPEIIFRVQYFDAVKIPVLLTAKFTHHARSHDLLGIGPRLAANLDLLLGLQFAIKDDDSPSSIDQHRASPLFELLTLAIYAGCFQQHGQGDTIAASHRRRCH